MVSVQLSAKQTLEGKAADARSDIFSFGLVMYEATAGRKAFTGKSQASLGVNWGIGQLAQFDRDGSRQEVFGEAGSLGNPELSSDQRLLLADIRDIRQGSRAAWARHLERGSPAR